MILHRYVLSFSMCLSVGCSDACVPSSGVQVARDDAAVKAPASPPPDEPLKKADADVAPARTSPAFGDGGPTRSDALPPLGNAAWLEPLDLGDGDGAAVAIPLGATSARPLILAVHGAGDRPEWACGGWRLGTDAYPFIVCPRGTPLASNSYAWSSWQQMERISLKAIEHVRKRFGPYVAEGAMTYAGFSQGATAAEPFLLRHAGEFPTIILAEGGYRSASSPQFARNLMLRGSRTVILVCGTRHCFENAARARPILEREKLRVFVGGDATSGHNLNLPMQRALRQSWKEWFADDPMWAGF